MELVSDITFLISLVLESLSLVGDSSVSFTYDSKDFLLLAFFLWLLEIQVSLSMNFLLSSLISLFLLLRLSFNFSRLSLLPAITLAAPSIANPYPRVLKSPFVLVYVPPTETTLSQIQLAAFPPSLSGANKAFPSLSNTFPKILSALLDTRSLIANPISDNGPKIFFLSILPKWWNVFDTSYFTGSKTASDILVSIPVAFPSSSLPKIRSFNPFPILFAYKALPATAPTKRPIGPPNIPAPANAPTDVDKIFFLLLAIFLSSGSFGLESP